MNSLKDPAASRGNIMVVDDNVANLKLLGDMLRQQRYEVRSFPRGRLALAAADQNPPELILLDIDMPEMNGYEVCELLKSNPRLAEIPVIFISALDALADKVKGFQAGGADYVSKPFQFEEVEARVDVQLRLRRAQQAEHELLEGTLAGAVWTLLELVQLTSPMLILRTYSIRDIVSSISRHMSVKNGWQYELASMLCLVGCIALPEELFEKAYGRQDLPPEEERTFQQHPEVAAKLIAHIPRLEIVAEIIRGQHDAPIDTSPSTETQQGVQMLQLALELDRRIYRNIECRAAVAQCAASGRFNERMLQALENYSPSKSEFDVRQVLIREVRSGMVLDEDMYHTQTKTLVFKEGLVFSYLWMERLANFSKSYDMPEKVRVRVPRLGRFNFSPMQSRSQL